MKFSRKVKGNNKNHKLMNTTFVLLLIGSISANAILVNSDLGCSPSFVSKIGTQNTMAIICKSVALSKIMILSLSPDNTSLIERSSNSTFNSDSIVNSQINTLVFTEMTNDKLLITSYNPETHQLSDPVVYMAPSATIFSLNCFETSSYCLFGLNTDTIVRVDINDISQPAVTTQINPFDFLVKAENREFGLAIQSNPHEISSFNYNNGQDQLLLTNFVPTSSPGTAAACPDLESFCIVATSFPKIIMYQEDFSLVEIVDIPSLNGYLISKMKDVGNSQYVVFTTNGQSIICFDYKIFDIEPFSTTYEENSIISVLQNSNVAVIESESTISAVEVIKVDRIEYHNCSTFKNIPEMECQTCLNGYAIDDDSLLCACPEKTFSAKYDFDCLPCDISCFNCTDGLKESCTSCAPGYLPHESKCISECPQGTLEVGQSCEACSSSCLSCEGTIDKCTSCLDSFYINGSECLPCPQNCSKCAIDSNTLVVSCLSCQQ